MSPFPEQTPVWRGDPMVAHDGQVIPERARHLMRWVLVTLSPPHLITFV
jgi:hypothetical protein